MRLSHAMSAVLDRPARSAEPAALRPPGPADPAMPRSPGLVLRALRAAGYAMLWAVMAAIALAYFHRVRLIGRRNWPRRGAALAFANHPATWTDVLIMHVTLRRRLHFLAQAELFRPWPRNWILHLFGTLPVFSSRDAADHASRNAATLAGCERLLERGEVVAMFPEGVSQSDRILLTLHRGAARLAIQYRMRHPLSPPLPLVPVGLHYSNRAAARSDVTLSVGSPVAAAGPNAAHPATPEAAASELTRRFAESLGQVMLDLPQGRDATVLTVFERIAEGRGHALGLGEARRIGATLGLLGQVAPAEAALLARRAGAHSRARHALRVSCAALEPRAAGVAAWGSGAALATLAVFGTLPALAGAVVNAVPLVLTELAGRRYAAEPSRVTFARIAVAMFAFPAAYVAFGVVIARLADLSLAPTLLVLAGCAALGAFTRLYVRAFGPEIERVRLARAAHRHPRLVRNLRAHHRALTEASEAMANAGERRASPEARR